MILACILICATIMCLGSACGKKEPEKAKPAETQTEEVQPLDFLGGKEFSAEETRKMSNYMNYGKYIFHGSWFYGVSFVKHEQALTKKKTDGTEKTVLNNDIPSFINFVDEWVYFLATDHDKGNDSIKKTRLSGDGDTTIVKADDMDINSVLIYNNTLYYSKVNKEEAKSSGKLCCCDLDGKNQKTILEKPVFFPYIVNDNILYQDLKDGDKLHICNIDGENDRVLIDKHVFRYVINGKKIYYQCVGDKYYDSKGNIKDEYFMELRSCNLDGTKDKIVEHCENVYHFSIVDNVLYFSNADDNYRIYRYNLKTKFIDILSQDINSAFIIALGGDKLLYMKHDKNWNYFDNIYICNLDGTNKYEPYQT